MSNEQEHNEEHAPPIKTPKQLITTIVLAFILPVVIILLLVNMVVSGTKMGAGSDTLSQEATGKRIAPVAGFELVDANAPKVLKTGEQVYQAVCAACHTAGVAGAPKVGDQAAWAPFIKSGFEAMLNVAIHGKGAMPPKGGNPTLSDYEVARAVVYMANQSGGSLEEPPAPDADTPAKTQAPAPAAQPAQDPAAPVAATPPPAGAPAPVKADASENKQAAVDPGGEKLYKSTCFACHGTGVAGAPKLGDKAAWAKYVETGMDTMVKVAIQGKGAMPPKGGAMNASEDEIRAAVQYMVDSVK